MTVISYLHATQMT